MENFGQSKNYVNKPAPFFIDQIVKIRSRILKKFYDFDKQKI